MYQLCSIHVLGLVALLTTSACGSDADISIAGLYEIASVKLWEGEDACSRSEAPIEQVFEETTLIDVIEDPDVVFIEACSSAIDCSSAARLPVSSSIDLVSLTFEPAPGGWEYRKYEPLMPDGTETEVDPTLCQFLASAVRLARSSNDLLITINEYSLQTDMVEDAESGESACPEASQVADQFADLTWKQLAAQHQCKVHREFRARAHQG